MNIHRVIDDTFVIEKNGYPYHVIEGMEEYEGLYEAYLNDPHSFIHEHPEQYEPTEEDIAQARIFELQAYLDSTDWYAVRLTETSVAIPEDVAAKRQAARDEISTLRGNVKA